MMSFLVLAVAGLYGLIIGSFLNVVAYRVPAGIPLVRESRCPSCGEHIRWWQNVPVISWVVLRGRCAACAARISGRYPIVEAATGIAFAGVAWWAMTAGAARFVEGGAAALPSRGLLGIAGVGDPAVTWSSGPEVWIVLVAFLGFAAVSIVLTLIDLDTRRLPSAIVVPSIAGGIVLLGAAAVVATATGSADAGWGELLRALAGAVILYAFYFTLRRIKPRGMGGGDVRLAALVGLYLGWTGWGALAVGAFAAFLFAGVYAGVLMLLRRAGRKTAIPFGPWMIAGAWAGIALGEPVWRWYLGLLGMH
ncbi:prepilin peptidase [Microbacterium sp. NPDC056052]|uniref:prepilin peptidase n=1 Tax=Microbacterium sp. NPDC056052 TaxID=3345695 RepID=UPI0035DC2952